MVVAAFNQEKARDYEPLCGPSFQALILSVTHVVARHVIIDGDGLGQEGVQVQGGEADPVEGAVPVDGGDDVQPRLPVHSIS